MAIKYLNNKNRFVIDSYGKYFPDERINNLFCNKKIRFTPPNEFNDPLEFKPILKAITFTISIHFKVDLILVRLV